MKLALTEWYYWHISRKTQKFIPWVARKLPKRIKYYVVVDGLARISVFDKPDEHPGTIKGFDLLALWNPDKE